MTWTHERLKARSFTIGKQVTSIQPKLDGFRLTLFKQPDGQLYAFGRDVRSHLEFTHRFPRITESNWFCDALSLMPEQSSIDGELWIPGRPATDVPTALRDYSLPLEFAAFAVPWWDGVDRANEAVGWLPDALRGTDIEFVVSKSIMPLTSSMCVESLLKEARQERIEGWVLKESNYSGWYKLKEVRSVDAIVTGFKDGRGKFEGMVGSLIVAVWHEGKLVTIANVSGMTEDERWDMTIEEEKLVGRVCEVKYQYVGSGGKLRHPRFVRWRPDKPSVECTMEQL